MTAISPSRVILRGSTVSFTLAERERVAQELGHFFLEFHEALRALGTGRRTRELALEPRDLAGKRVHRLRPPTALARRQTGARAFVAQTAPVAEVRRVQPMATQHGANLAPGRDRGVDLAEQLPLELCGERAACRPLDDLGVRR